jgi:hypothetical protein
LKRGEVGQLSEKEKGIKEDRRKKVVSESIAVSELIDQPGQIPGFGPSIELAGNFATPTPSAGYSIMAEKTARGCEYNYKKQQPYVEPPYAVMTAVRRASIVPEPQAAVSQTTVYCSDSLL